MLVKPLKVVVDERVDGSMYMEDHVTRTPIDIFYVVIFLFNVRYKRIKKGQAWASKENHARWCFLISLGGISWCCKLADHQGGKKSLN